MANSRQPRLARAVPTLRTATRRPDLLDEAQLSKADRILLAQARQALADDPSP